MFGWDNLATQAELWLDRLPQRIPSSALRQKVREECLELVAAIDADESLMHQLEEASDVLISLLCWVYRSELTAALQRTMQDKLRELYQRTWVWDEASRTYRHS